MCVPSGNFGNITAGLFAKKMGLPIHQFIASNNRNNVFQQYYLTGQYSPRPSVATPSNAMDVGNPSNFQRMMDIYGNSVESVREDIASYSYNDEQTLEVRNSSCKRMNMFLRWMVRKDNCGVDFGLWNKISPAQLLCPLDVHVDRVARRLGLISRKQTDWKTVLELTENLRLFDPEDPVKYDFALFSMGVDS